MGLVLRDRTPEETTFQADLDLDLALIFGSDCPVLNSTATGPKGSLGRDRRWPQMAQTIWGT